MATIGAPRPSLALDLGGFLPGSTGGGGLIGGGGPTGFPAPGTISIGGPIGGTSTGTGGGSTSSAGYYPATAVNWATDVAGALLGLDWGRIAAFVLGLILIAGGIFLIKSVRQQVTVVVKHAGRVAAQAAEASAAA